MTRVAVLGASGFVGSAVIEALVRRGATPVPVASPRLETAARNLDAIRAELTTTPVLEATARLRTAVEGCDSLVNAAGIASATGAGDALFGANALLPAVLASAAAPSQRVVHVSSAAVQGRRRVLDESRECSPFSPYSMSKALGEASVHAVLPPATIYRPTSVHGEGRAVTRSLIRVLRSPMASVASASNPTPQVLVGNVGDAIAFLATTDEQPAPIVLHPWEGLTTRGLYDLLGGRRPIEIPMPLARALIAAGHGIGRLSARISGTVRRVEMLWLGQGQGPSWLDGRWEAPQTMDAWRDLR